MPVGLVATDLAQIIRSAVERSSGIPAALDAYSEFVDSPIGHLELANLESVFSAILGNLSERFPQIASQKAATNARNDIEGFLSISNNNVDRVKSALVNELMSSNRVMAASISERFSRASPEERRAIDATLRLIRKSQEEIIFRAEAGKGMEGSGPDFERFFAAVRAQSPTMKELRFQNLIVEKGIFNKLVLKTGDRRNSSIWVPSFFAKENLDFLIERAGVASEHLLYSRLKELRDQGKLDALRPLLTRFVGSRGVLPLEDVSREQISTDIEDFVSQSANKKFLVLTPIELDDISTLFGEELQEQRRMRAEAENKKDELRRNMEAQERDRVEELRRQQERRRQSKNAQLEQQRGISERTEDRREKSAERIYLGKALDADELASALVRRLPEKEIEAQVKMVGDFFVDLSEVKQNGVSIIGSSGSGRSTTLRRLLDGIASASSASGNLRIIVIDQKGEHRGIAWKYKWSVLAFAADSQSRQFRLPSFLPMKDEQGGSELAASLIQEWALGTGVNCSEQQRERISSIIKAQESSATAESVTKALQAEPELSLIGQKLARNILARSAFSRIFSDQSTVDIGTGSVIFDVSGRGLRDPTTREERLIASVFVLKTLLDSDLQFSIVVIEDVLDRFKSDALRRKVVQYVTKLREKGNTIVATSRSQIREYVSGSSLEILHRLSGEKVVSEVISGFKTNGRARNMVMIVTFLPRGYAFTSSIDISAGSAGTANIPSSALKVEPLQFSTAVS